ncbi:adhesin HecA-like repeat protein, partial [Fusobacterium sp. PH5-44]
VDMINNTEGTMVAENIYITGNSFSNKEGDVIANKGLTIKSTDVGNIEGSLVGEDISIGQSSTVSNIKGLIYGKNSLSILANRLENLEGSIYTDGRLEIVTNFLDNTKGEIIGGLENLGGTTLVNEEGLIVSTKALTVLTENVTNILGEIYSQERLTFKGTALDNKEGLIHTAGGITMEVTDIINKSGYILANGISKEAADAEDEENTNNESKDTDLVMEEEIKESTELAANEEKTEENEKGIYEGIDIAGNSLDNTDGKIKTIGDVNISVNAVLNISGVILGDNIKFQGKTLDNTEGSITGTTVSIEVSDKIDNTKGEIIGIDSLEANTDTLVNVGGAVVTNGSLVLTTDTLDNTKGEIIGGLENLGGTTLINDEGLIVSTKALTILTENVTNILGEIYSQERLTFKGTTLDNTEGLIHTAGGITMEVTDIINKSGYILANGISKEAADAEDEPKGESKETDLAENKEDSDKKESDESAELATNVENEDEDTTELVDNTEDITEEEKEIYEGIDIAGNTLDNTDGKIKTVGDMTVAVKEILNVSGIILGDKIEIAGNNLNNTEGNITGSDVSIEMAIKLDNTKGEIIGVDSLEIKADTLVNKEGTLATNGSLVLDTDNLDNTKGEIIGALEKLGGTTLVNDEGKILSTKELEVAVQDVSNKSGEIYSQERLVFNGKTLDNTEGLIHTAGGITMEVTDIINKSGYILANGISKEVADAEDEPKEESKDTGLVVEEETEESTELAANEESTEEGEEEKEIYEGINIAGNTLDNTDGKIKTVGDMTVAVKEILNISGIILGDKIKITGNNLDSTEGNISGSSVDITMNGTITNNKGSIIGLEDLSIKSNNIYNKEGEILSNGSLVLDTQNILDNTKGEIVGKLEKLNGNKLINDEGSIFTSEELAINTKNVSNKKGEIYANGKITVNGNNLDNTLGYIHSNRGITMNVTNVTNKSGYVLSDGLTKEMLKETETTLSESQNTEKSEDKDGESSDEDDSETSTEGIKISGTNLDNTNGTIRGIGDLAIKANTNNTQGIIIGANVGITGNLNNTKGNIQGENVTVKGSSINNTSGSILGTTVNVTGNIESNNKGNISADELNIKGNINNNDGEILANDIDIKGSIVGNSKGNITGNEINITGNFNNDFGKILGNNVKIVGASVSNVHGNIEVGNIEAQVGSFNNNHGYVHGLGAVELTNVSNNYGQILSESYVEINNKGDLNTNYGTIRANNVEGGVVIDAGGQLHYTGGSITSVGTVVVDTRGSITVDDRILGEKATSITADTVSTTGDVYRTGDLELEGRDKLNINGVINANILSLSTNNDLTLNHAMTGRDKLHITGGAVTNNSILHGGEMLSINARTITNNSQIKSEQDLYIEGKDIYNQNGGLIEANELLAIKGGNLYNITTSSRDGDNVTLGEGSQILGKEVYIDITGTLVNGTHDVGGTSTREDGTIKDNRKGTNTGVQISTIAGNEITSISAGNVTNRGNIGKSGIGATYIETTGSIYNEKTGNFNNGNILGNTVTLKAGRDINNVGALIKGTEGTYVIAKGNITNQSTVIDGIVLQSHKEDRTVGKVSISETSLQNSLENSWSGKNSKRINEKTPDPNKITLKYGKVTLEVPEKLQKQYEQMLAEGRDVTLKVTTSGGGWSGGCDSGGQEELYYEINIVETYTVVDLKGEGIGNVGTIESDGYVYVEGNNITNIGGVIAGGTGTMLDAKQDIKDTSITLRYNGKDVYMASSPWGAKTWDIVSGTNNASGMIGLGGDTILQAGRDINLINSDLFAENNLVLYADRYLNSLAVMDTEYRYDYEKKKSGKIKKKVTVKEWIMDNEYANGTTMNAGGNIYLNYGLTDKDKNSLELKNKGIFLQGVDMYAGGNVIAKSTGNIFTEGTKDDIYSYYKKKTSSSILGFTYKKTSSKIKSQYDNYNLTNLYGSQGFMMDSGDHLTIVGADIRSQGSVLLLGKNGVTIRPGQENGYYIEEHKSSGFSGSFGSSGMSLSYGKSKTTINSDFTNYVETTIFAGESVKIVSDEGKISLTSTHIQAGEDIVLNGKTGVELLVAENYNKTVEKHKSTSIGISLNFGFRPTQLVNSINDATKADYSFGNKSQAINTLGNRFQDIRTISSLGSKVYDGINAGSGWLNPDSYFRTHGTPATQEWIDGQRDKALNSLFDLSASISFSSNKSSSKTESTSSVGGSLVAGGNIQVSSEGDVTFIGQTIDAGKNIEIKADNFFAGASMDTYYNKSKSSSTGASLGYDFLGKAATGSFNMNKSKSNTDMVQYNNTIINAGGDFILTTIGSATFSGANIEGEHLLLDIGGNLTVESLQDKMNSSSKSSGFGLSLSNINPSTMVKNPTSSLSGSINGSKSKGKQAWVNNQTSLVGREGGTINVGNTLTNTGSIIGSLNENAPMIINAKEIVVNDLKDKDYSKNAGFGISGITADLKVPQASIQYGMSDKRQDTNSTFVNSIAYENGVKVNFEERGINTSLDNAQVITRDKEIEQIDTTLHTDMLNQSTRQQFVIDFLKTTTLVPQIGKGIYQGLKDDKKGILGQLNLNMGINGGKIVAFAKDTKGKIKDILKDAELIDGELYLNLNNTYEINELLKEVLAEQGKSFYDINYVIGENPNNLMAVDDSNGVININLIGLGFGNANNFLTGILHEGGHGTYANAATDEKAVGALTGKIVYDQNKGIILSDDLARKVQGDTVQYFADRADGKLNDLAIGKNFSMAFTPIIRINGGQTSYIVIDTQNGKGYEVTYKEMGIGVGIDIGFSWNSVILPEINHPSELSGNSRSIGSSIFYWGYEYQKEGNNTITGGKYVGHKNGQGMGFLPFSAYASIDSVFDSPKENSLREFTPTANMIEIAKKIEDYSKATGKEYMANIWTINALAASLDLEVQMMKEESKRK